MTLYKITKAEKHEIKPMFRGMVDEVAHDHAQGRDIHQKIRGQRAIASATRPEQIRENLGKCRFTKKPCPNADHDHFAIKSGDELYCPITVMIWRFMVAFGDGEGEEFLQKFRERGGINAFIRILTKARLQYYGCRRGQPGRDEGGVGQP